MSVLVLGATGGTGRLVVEQLIKRGRAVLAIVRSIERLPPHLLSSDYLTVVEASLLDLSDSDLAEHVKGCEAVVSCLGHNLNLRGIFGPPRTLVRDGVAKVCRALAAARSVEKTRFVLMSTTAYRNPDVDDRVSFAHRMVIGLMRLLVPPQADNEQAAEYLRVTVGQRQEHIEWVMVRPDTLIDEDRVTEHEEHPSPIRDAVFNAGQTSRINVADFMADLITDEGTWFEWKGMTPVIYNSGQA